MLGCKINSWSSSGWTPEPDSYRVQFRVDPGTPVPGIESREQQDHALISCKCFLNLNNPPRFLKTIVVTTINPIRISNTHS
jgi:hypothetical protein